MGLTKLCRDSARLSGIKWDSAGIGIRRDKWDSAGLFGIWWDERDSVGLGWDKRDRWDSEAEATAARDSRNGRDADCGTETPQPRPSESSLATTCRGCSLLRVMAQYWRVRRAPCTGPWFGVSCSGHERSKSSAWGRAPTAHAGGRARPAGCRPPPPGRPCAPACGARGRRRASRARRRRWTSARPRRRPAAPSPSASRAAVSRADCARGPSLPSMLTGSPTTMPPIPSSAMSARRDSMSRESLVRRSVVRAVAIVRLTSETATPIVLAPRSSPNRRASAASRPFNALNSQIAMTCQRRRSERANRGVRHRAARRHGQCLTRTAGGPSSPWCAALRWRGGLRRPRAADSGGGR